MSIVAGAQASAIAGVACVAICLVAALLRQGSAKRHATRISQLQKSAELFRYHTKNLELFLDAPSAPRALKVMLLRFTEVMADRDATVYFARWMSKQPLEPVVSPDAEMQDLLQLVENLQQSDPNLAGALSSALVCGVFGAMLRWPESAQYFDLTVSNILATGRREVTAAIYASKMRERPMFDLSINEPAMA